MSFLKKLFGGGAESANGKSSGREPKVLDREEYNGFVIKAIEMRAGSEYQLCGSIEKEFGGEVKAYQFIRADRLTSPDLAASAALGKGRQIIDEQGDNLFG